MSGSVPRCSPPWSVCWRLPSASAAVASPCDVPATNRCSKPDNPPSPFTTRGDPKMKCLMLIKHTEDYRSKPIPQGLMDAMEAFVGEGFKSGVLKDTAGLKPTADASRIRLKGGKLQVMDGPFTEAKEVIGGYALVEVPSKKEAL